MYSITPLIHADPRDKTTDAKTYKLMLQWNRHEHNSAERNVTCHNATCHNATELNILFLINKWYEQFQYLFYQQYSVLFILFS